MKLYYELQTTGYDPRKNSITKLSGLLEVDGVPVEYIEITMQPHPMAKIDPQALDKNGETLESIMAYQTMDGALKELKAILYKYVDRFNPKQKIFLVGFNNRSFHDVFLRRWFELCGDSYFGSYFWSDSHDVLVMASVALQHIRPDMPSFKFERVLKELGITHEEFDDPVISLRNAYLLLLEALTIKT